MIEPFPGSSTMMVQARQTRPGRSPGACCSCLRTPGRTFDHHQVLETSTGPTCLAIDSGGKLNTVPHHSAFDFVGVTGSHGSASSAAWAMALTQAATTGIITNYLAMPLGGRCATAAAAPRPRPSTRHHFAGNAARGKVPLAVARSHGGRSSYSAWPHGQSGRRLSLARDLRAAFQPGLCARIHLARARDTGQLHYGGGMRVVHRARIGRQRHRRVARPLSRDEGIATPDFITAASLALKQFCRTARTGRRSWLRNFPALDRSRPSAQAQRLTGTQTPVTMPSSRARLSAKRSRLNGSSAPGHESRDRATSACLRRRCCWHSAPTLLAGTRLTGQQATGQSLSRQLRRLLRGVAEAGRPGVRGRYRRDQARCPGRVPRQLVLLGLGRSCPGVQRQVVPVVHRRSSRRPPGALSGSDRHQLCCGCRCRSRYDVAHFDATPGVTSSCAIEASAPAPKSFARHRSLCRSAGRAGCLEVGSCAWRVSLSTSSFFAAMSRISPIRNDLRARRPGCSSCCSEHIASACLDGIEADLLAISARPASRCRPWTAPCRSRAWSRP